jgi:hypothetical protein
MLKARLRKLAKGRDVGVLMATKPSCPVLTAWATHIAECTTGLGGRFDAHWMFILNQ